MMNNDFRKTDYIIFSKPDFIKFECPYCKEEVKTDFNNIDYDTDYWGDGGWVDCPHCEEEVRLGNYEYD